MKISIRAFALTCGIVWGLGLFAITWWIIAFDGQQPGVAVFLGQIYRGYELTTTGSLIGLAWGFCDGLAGGLVFAWLYNLLAGQCAKRCTEQASCCTQ